LSQGQANLSQWFSHFDRDRNGTLEREEVVLGLQHTIASTSGNYQQSDPQAIRETVYAVWPTFDRDGSGSIDRVEFCASGGLGESLVAMLGGGGGNISDAPTPQAGYLPPPIPYGEQQQQQLQYDGGSYNPTAPTAEPVQEFMGVPIPEGIIPGRKMKVQLVAGDPPQEVTVPGYTEWKYNESNAPYFLIPTTPSPVVQAVAYPVANAPSFGASAPPNNPNSNYNGMAQNRFGPQMTNLQMTSAQFPIQTSNQQFQQQQQQQQQQQPWTPWEHFQPHPYQEPPLRMQPVAQHEFNQGNITASGRRRALLIGINYPGTKAELRGCANDAINMKRLLIQNGFQDDSTHMLLLSDNQSATGGGRWGGSNKSSLPTAANIRRGMQWLVHNASQGDVLFFHFSGHGAQVPDKTGMESDGYNETILPSDYKNSGQICDDEIWGTLVYPLLAGVKLTAVMDCCHSGTGMDLPLDYDIKGQRWREDTNPCYSRGDVTLFSGCEDDQTSADVQGGKYSGGGAGGAMTQSFVAALDGNPMPTYADFIGIIRMQLKKRGFTQKPQLTSSQRFEVGSRIFMLADGIEGNQNSEVGRLLRKKCKKGKAKKFDGLEDLAMGVAAVYLGGKLLDAIF